MRRRLLVKLRDWAEWFILRRIPPRTETFRRRLLDLREVENAHRYPGLQEDEDCNACR